MLRLTCLLILSISVLTGCGGSPSEPVPDVVGDRLDVAKSTVSDAGYDVEEIGGGTFGIVVESNWTVCETEPAAGATGDGTVKLIVDRECRDTGKATEIGDTGAEPEPATTPKPRKKRKRKPDPTSEPASALVTVPNVIGMDHQAAQNRMQATGLYNLRERDASGQGRMMLWDRNWVVVDQRPAAGTQADELTKIVLLSVKEGEL